MGEQMTEPYSWRLALDRALQRNRRQPHSRYFQLASIDSTGAPHNRTVVFRGFDTDDQTLLAITDQRAAKCAQIARDDRVAIAWYFTQTREQFRITGRARLYTHNGGLNDESGGAFSCRMRVWQRLSEAAKGQFFWAEPGAPLTDAERAGGQDSTPLTSGDEVSARPPETFTVLAITPARIDHLVLTQPQQRLITTLDRTQTSTIAVNP